MADVELLLDELHRTAPSGVPQGRLRLAATARRRGAGQHRDDAMWQAVDGGSCSLSDRDASQVPSVEDERAGNGLSWWTRDPCRGAEDFSGRR